MEKAIGSLERFVLQKNYFLFAAPLSRPRLERGATDSSISYYLLDCFPVDGEWYKYSIRRVPLRTIEFDLGWKSEGKEINLQLYSAQKCYYVRASAYRSGGRKTRDRRKELLLSSAVPL